MFNWKVNEICMCILSTNTDIHFWVVLKNILKLFNIISKSTWKIVCETQLPFSPYIYISIYLWKSAYILILNVLSEFTKGQQITMWLRNYDYHSFTKTKYHD